MPEAFTVPQFVSTQIRVDVWLASVSAHSRSRIKALIESGCVSSDGVSVVSPSRNVKVGEVYIIDEPSAKPSELLAQAMPLEILFEDDAMLVIDKPPSLVVHPAPGHPDGTLVNALLAHCPGVLSVGGEERPGIVHRLDQDTSGTIVVAKTDAALTALAEAFQQGRVHKTYLTLVHGIPSPQVGRIENLIGRHPVNRQQMAVVLRNGKTAITRYRVIEAWPFTSLLQVEIETGRTHQIRVHMKQLGCPVVGDATYGRAKLDAELPRVPDRQLLHAWRLTLPHPGTGEVLTFEAPLPIDFTTVLDALRGANTQE